MRAAAALLRERTRVGPWRLAATWVLLFAFALQAYVTQTHFHPEALRFAPHASAQKAPPGGEAIACPLCQAVASAGAFLSPGAAPALLLVARAILVSRAPARAGRDASPAGFAWRSRAPPQP